jgi:hypothetical protein
MRVAAFVLSLLLSCPVLMAALPQPDPEAPNFCQLRLLEEKTKPILAEDMTRILDLKAKQDSLWARFVLPHREGRFEKLDPALRQEIIDFILEVFQVEAEFGMENIWELGLDSSAIAQIVNYGGAIPTFGDLMNLEENFLRQAQELLSPSLSAREVALVLNGPLWSEGAMLQQLPPLYNEVFPDKTFVAKHEEMQKVMGAMMTKAELRFFNEENLEQHLRAVWDAQTSWDAAGWSQENPAWGHGAVTAAFVQDVLGGEIVWAEAVLPDGRKFSHYKNLVQGKELDFTKAQFPEGTVIPEGVEKKKSFASTRDYVLSYAATQERYETLKKRLLARLPQD